MTIEQAVKAIESHLEFYIDEVPDNLLKKIHKIILSAKRVVEKEIILQDQREEKPDIQKEWELICEKHNIDTIKAKTGRQMEKVIVRTHFIRHLFLSYKYVTVADVGRFLKYNHATVIHSRDVCKCPCIYPPFGKKHTGNRGGARQGAGSKPKYNEETNSLSFRCPASKVDELKNTVKSKLSEWSKK